MEMKKKEIPLTETDQPHSKRVRPRPIQDPTAHSYDRDKNKTYLANDEAVDEIVDEEGLRVVHPNRDLGSTEA